MSEDKLTSIIIPVYNEADYIISVLDRCCALPIDKEIIVVDNNSTDNSYSLISDYAKLSPCKLIVLKCTRQGKANAIRHGLLHARGDNIVFQDADGEYDPKYIFPIVEELQHYSVVHGCRICRPYAIGIGPFLANKILLSLIQNKFNISVNDIFTGQRGYRRNVLEQFEISSKGFELETELTMFTIYIGFMFKEIDVPYVPRNKTEGKKISMRDFLAILFSYFSVSHRLSKKDFGKTELAPIHRQQYP
jgi:glycosyltransferase involved in cell wall biosynthesis